MAKKDKRVKPKADDVNARIAAFEAGELGEREAVELFQELIDSGMVWNLQGSYGRKAQEFIQRGLCHAAPRKTEREEAHAPPPPATPSKQPLSDRGREGPYVGIQFDRLISFRTPEGPRHFRVIVYAAYDAMGLVGAECNGVAILDDDQKRVLCDEVAKAESGYYGASQKQLDSAAALVDGSNWDSFRAFVNSSPRARYKI